MRPRRSDVRTLIAIRVVVVTSLLLAALLIQFTVAEVVLPIDYLYLTTALAFALTFVYIGLHQMVESREINLYAQMLGDLLVETVLVYFTGGLDSPFSFLYLVTIITAAMLLYRRGGLLIASASAILYGSLVDLMYYGVIPVATDSVFAPSSWSAVRLYLNIGANFAGFYATAVLTSYVSEQLRKTAIELSRKRETLAQLEELNQRVVESIPSGLLTTDTQGVITSINPAACEILGVDPDIVGAHVTSTGFFSIAEWEMLRSSGFPVLRGEKQDFLRRSEVRDLGYAMTPLTTPESGVYGYTVIFQDLTGMKQLEAQLRLKDRMAAVGELSAGIAHEIRNPLAAIAGSVQVLKNSERLTPQEQRLMSIILKESDRLNKSIADFLRFVRPQVRFGEQFDIAAVLAETMDLLSHSSELQPNHRISREIDPPSFSITGDADQMRQVFWNLARNAIQAMPDGGNLRVAAAPDGDSYRIVFSDEGRGMSELEQRSLFQPFRTNFPSGTGLGMAISFRIIQEHDGEIAVDSAVGVGTTISIRLPITQGTKRPKGVSPVVPLSVDSTFHP
jgi:two-component system sensor histidine kinase PilS (NtrC family)